MDRPKLLEEGLKVITHTSSKRRWTETYLPSVLGLFSIILLIIFLASVDIGDANFKAL